jgi:dTDP-glucose 4,6-dehydratase
MKNKVLFFVLGSNSFTGSNFVNYLINLNQEVVCISRSKESQQHFLAYSKKSKKKIFYNFDINFDHKKILRLIKKKRPKYIINFSSQSMVGQSWFRPIDWYTTNVLGNIKLVESIKNFKFIKRYLNVSTPEVYGSTGKNIKESINYKPSTPYAISRACFDNHLFAIYKQFKFPVIFTRASNVYGPSQRLYRIIPAAIRSATKNDKLNLDGGGKSERNFIFVQDVVEATFKILMKGKIGNIYHISSNEIISIKNLVRKIYKINNNKNFNKNIKYSKDRVGKDKIYYLNSLKLKKDLNWNPKINLETGIKKTIDWFKKNEKKFKKKDLEYKHKK